MEESDPSPVAKIVSAGAAGGGSGAGSGSVPVPRSPPPTVGVNGFFGLGGYGGGQEACPHLLTVQQDGDGLTGSLVRVDGTAPESAVVGTVHSDGSVMATPLPDSPALPQVGPFLPEEWGARWPAAVHR